MTKTYSNEHPKYKKNNQDKNIKVADLKVGGKTYTPKQFKKLTPKIKKHLIWLSGWEYGQRGYDELEKKGYKTK